MRRRHLVVIAAVTATVFGGAAPAAFAASTGAPRAVGHVKGASTSSTSALLSWTNPSSASFRSTLVRYAKGTTAPASPTKGTSAGLVSKTHHSLTIGKLSSGVRYSFALFATDGHGHYAHRVPVGVTIAPGPVSGVAAFDHGSYTSVDWTNPKTPSFDALTIRYAKGSTAPSSPTRGSAVPVAWGRKTTARLPHLAADTTYTVAVWAHDYAKRYATVATTTFTTRATATTPAAKITGTATDSHHAPLAGVFVELSGDYSDVQASTTTGSDGTYSLTVPPGSYYVGFDGEGATGGDSDATGYVGDSQDVQATSGHTTTGVDATLTPGGVITGRVTDAAGDPLAGVLPYLKPVLAYVQVDSSFLFGYSFDTGHPHVTAADGTFTLKGVYPAAVRTCLDPSSFDPSSSGVTGGSDDSAGYVQRCAQTSVLVPAGQSVAVPDIALESAAAGVVAGTVTNASGHPVANALVEINPTSQASDGGGFAVTSEDGTYRAGGVVAGSYNVCVDTYGETLAANDVGDALTCLPHAIAVHTGATTTADVRLTRGGAVAGKLTGKGGVPLVGVMVDLSSGDSEGDGAGGEAVTDSHGHFVLKGLAAGSYTACFDASSATGAGLTTGASSSCYRNNAKIQVKAGVTRLGIDAQLGAGGAITGTVKDDLGNPLSDVSVSASSTSDYDNLAGGFGTTDAQGRYSITGLPTGSYDVCFYPGDPTALQSASCYGAATQDDQGTKVTVHAGSTTSHIDAALSTGGSITVTVHDQDGNPIAGVNATALSTCDLDEEGDCGTQPLFSATKATAVDASDVTDSDGAVTLSSLAPGNYAVCLFAYFGATGVDNSATGYADACHGGSTFDVSVTAHHTTDVTQTLAPGGEVTGTITDAGGQPLAGVRVDVSDSGANDFDNGFDNGFDGLPDEFADPNTLDPEVLTGADGTYRVHGVTPGARTVCVEASAAAGPTGYLDQCVGGQPGGTDGTDGTTITVTAGATTSGVDLALTAGAAISGKITDTAGHVLADSEAGVFTPAGDLVGQTEAAGNGTYAIDRVPAGSYVVCFYAYGYVNQCYKGVDWKTEDLPTGTTKVVAVIGSTTSGINAKLRKAVGGYTRTARPFELRAARAHSSGR
jgi:protocatechuate 3,4-dioxygenase beta subunit